MKDKNMTYAEKAKKGEKFLLEQGLFTFLPTNLLILLTQKERDVITVIRHSQNNGQSFISVSSLSVMTGLSDKTVRDALKSLLALGFISKGKTNVYGTQYEVNYMRLNNAIAELNMEKDPIKRLKLADSLRGEGFEIHTGLIQSLGK